MTIEVLRVDSKKTPGRGNSAIGQRADDDGGVHCRQKSEGRQKKAKMILVVWIITTNGIIHKKRSMDAEWTHRHLGRKESECGGPKIDGSMVLYLYRGMVCTSIPPLSTSHPEPGTTASVIR